MPLPDTTLTSVELIILNMETMTNVLSGTGARVMCHDGDTECRRSVKLFRSLVDYLFSLQYPFYHIYTCLYIHFKALGCIPPLLQMYTVKLFEDSI